MGSSIIVQGFLLFLAKNANQMEFHHWPEKRMQTPMPHRECRQPIYQHPPTSYSRNHQLVRCRPSAAIEKPLQEATPQAEIDTEGHSTESMSGALAEVIDLNLVDNQRTD
jgi:hypothetical protein